MDDTSIIVAERSSFKIHLIEGYISNIYLVEYPSSLLLLDSGSIIDIPKIQNCCENICGRSMSEISLCVVSHMHPDHAGGASMLRKKFGIPVAAFHNVDRWYEGISGFIQHALDCRMEQFVGKTIGKKKESVRFSRQLNPEYILGDNDPLPFFGDWKAIHIPGHTLHDLAAYNETEKILHTGDAILTVNGRFRLPIPVFFKKAMRSSYKKLSDLDVKLILPGHGTVITTDNSSELFKHMSGLIDEPMSLMSRVAHRISLFTPAVWKGILKNLLGRMACP